MLTFELDKMTSKELRSVLDHEGVDLAEAERKARPIVDDVRLRGDVAVRLYAKRLDGLKGDGLRVPANQVRHARKRISGELGAALKVSKARIERFHKRQSLQQFEFKDDSGSFGQKVVPLERIGVYVPGGTANYASTVLMACVPARIAGVKEIAICTPGRGGRVPDVILAAADLCGVTEVYAVGGAHAIAAMAYGTESIKKVQKVVGPGGAIVAAAKLLVRNECEIDFLAGPSEVLVIADGKASPELVASDMLAQLEHDPQARAVMVSDSKNVLEAARKALERKVASAERTAIASKSSDKGGIFILARTLLEAVDFSNSYAPEHLLIDTAQPYQIMKSVVSAGSVFLGSYSSVAFGDYCSGTNHILPTKGMARSKSTLSVYDFQKVIPYQSMTRRGASVLSGTVGILARSEGLPAHAEAAEARKEGVTKDAFDR